MCMVVQPPVLSTHRAFSSSQRDALTPPQTSTPALSTHAALRLYTQETPATPCKWNHTLLSFGGSPPPPPLPSVTATSLTFQAEDHSTRRVLQSDRLCRAPPHMTVPLRVTGAPVLVSSLEGNRPQTHDHPASASLGLGSEVCATLPGHLPVFLSCPHIIRGPHTPEKSIPARVLPLCSKERPVVGSQVLHSSSSSPGKRPCRSPCFFTVG